MRPFDLRNRFPESRLPATIDDPRSAANQLAPCQPAQRTGGNPIASNRRPVRFPPRPAKKSPT